MFNSYKSNIRIFREMFPRATKKILCGFFILFFLSSVVILSINTTNGTNFDKTIKQTELPNMKYQYGVIIDAGSSGSRIFIYKWPPHSGSVRDLLQLTPLLDASGRPVVKKAEPGLSALATNPNRTGAYVRPLLDLAARSVPGSQHRQTPLYVMATAGMRMISEESRSAILHELRTFVRTNYNFLFSDSHAKVISGREEGIYGWIATNYLLGRFNHNHSDGVDVVSVKHPSSAFQSDRISHRKRTVGVLDMGGGSMQIAYEVGSDSQDVGDSDVKTVNLGSSEDDLDHTYKLYVTTFLGFGANIARIRYERVLLQQYLRNHKTLQKPTSSSASLQRSTSSSLQPIIVDPCLHPGLQFSSPVKQLSISNSSSDPGGLRLSIKQINALPSSTVTFQGTGQYHLCESRLFELLDKTACSAIATNQKSGSGIRANQKASNDKVCTMSGRSRPPVPEPRHSQFYGFSEFWYSTNDVYGLGGRYNYFRLHSKAMEYCKQSWFSISMLHKKNMNKRQDWPRMKHQCFKSAWLSTVLHSGLGFPLSYGRLTSVQEINGAEAQWSLGALLYQTRFFPQLAVSQQQKQLATSHDPHNRGLGLTRGYWQFPLLLLISTIVLLVLYASVHQDQGCMSVLGPGYWNWWSTWRSDRKLVDVSLRSTSSSLFQPQAAGTHYSRVNIIPSYLS